MALLIISEVQQFSQANGTAKRTVQKIKQMLKKESDPYLAMLTYRSSPQHGQYSPAKLSMGRKLKATILIHSDSLEPALLVIIHLKLVIMPKRFCVKENQDNNKKVQLL